MRCSSEGDCEARCCEKQTKVCEDYWPECGVRESTVAASSVAGVWERNPSSAGERCATPDECRRKCCLRTCSAFACPSPLVRRKGAHVAGLSCSSSDDADCERKCCVPHRVVCDDYWSECSAGQKGVRGWRRNPLSAGLFCENAEECQAKCCWRSCHGYWPCPRPLLSKQGVESATPCGSDAECQAQCCEEPQRCDAFVDCGDALEKDPRAVGRVCKAGDVGDCRAK